MQQLFNLICTAAVRRHTPCLLLVLVTTFAACEGPAGTGDTGSTGGSSAAAATGGGSAAPAVQTGNAGTDSNTVLYTTDTGYRSGYSTDSSRK
jgi:hypothetical protein